MPNPFTEITKIGVAGMENLGTIDFATGALGIAAMGIVDALKWTPIGCMGLAQINDYSVSQP